MKRSVEFLARWVCSLLGFVVPSALPLAAPQPSLPVDPPLPVLDWEPRSDWLNVREYGAIGDSQTDDTEAIQTALNKLENGGVLYLPPGTYRISQTLLLAQARRMEGVGVFGHGRTTRLVWHGAEGEALFHPDGVSYSYFRGIVFDGRNIAAVGILKKNRFFETESTYRDLAFLNFTNAGFLVHPNRLQAVAEPIFDNCFFAHNRRGIAFTRFNDYNFVLVNCEFRDNDIGLLGRNGQFMLRNSHFANNREADIVAQPHHASSVRRVTSAGSRTFIRFESGTAAFAIQDVRVTRWTDPQGALQIRGAPVLLFDSRFEADPAGSPAVVVTGEKQRLIVSNNSTDPGRLLYSTNSGTLLYEIFPSARTRSPLLRSTEQRFLQSTVRIPRRMFDARRDFGAKGDGRSDDTQSLQAAIDAARHYGQDAIAYLPRGTYRITQTLTLGGSNYFVGGAGSGFGTRLKWDGPENGVILSIHQPQNLVLENMMVGHHNVGRMSNAVDILYTSNPGGSSMVLEGIWTFGAYQKQPDQKGIVFRDLGAGDQVLLRHVQGNLRIQNCAGSVIFASVAHEGALTVRGYHPPGGTSGFLGIVSRLATLTPYAVDIGDNSSIGMSDCYNEQSATMFRFSGSRKQPPGRITWTGGRSHCRADGEPTMRIEGYRGELFIGGKDFSDYRWKSGLPPRTLSTSGDPFPSIVFFGNLMMGSNLKVEPVPKLRVALLGNQSHPHSLWVERVPLEDQYTDTDLAAMGRAFDDLNLLGLWDLALMSPSPPEPPPLFPSPCHERVLELVRRFHPGCPPVALDGLPLGVPPSTSGISCTPHSRNFARFDVRFFPSMAHRRGQRKPRPPRSTA